MTEESKSLVSRGTRSSSKKQIDQLKQKLIESEKANSSLKLEKIELANENADLKEKLNLVTEELRELKLKKGNSNFFLNRSSWS